MPVCKPVGGSRIERLHKNYEKCLNLSTSQSTVELQPISTTAAAAATAAATAAAAAVPRDVNGRAGPALKPNPAPPNK